MPDPSSRRPSLLMVAVLLGLLAVNLYLLFVSTDLARELAPQRLDQQVLATADADIRRLLDDQVKAWNRGDLDGFMAGYWESEQLRFASGGTVTTGFKATKERYYQRYKADGKEMGTLTFSDVQVEVYSSKIAIVRGRWRLKFKDSQDEPNGLYTLTLRYEKPGGWKITSDHTSASEPPKQPTGD